MKKKLIVLGVVLVILSAGCSINKNSNSYEYYENQNLLVNGIESNDFELVKCAIDNGADLNSLGHNTINTEKNPLFTSLCNSDKKIVLLLLENGANVNYKSGRLYDGSNCLMIAAINKYEDVCKLLIKEGIDINEKDNEGQNAIDYAIQARSDSYFEEKEILNLVKMLYKEGVKISNKTKENILNENESNHELGKTNVKYEIIKWLIDIGEIEEIDLGENQKIFYNVYLENINYIKKLDDSKLKIKNSSKQTLLDVAAKYGKTNIVEYLLNKGFNPKKETVNGFYINSIVYAATSGNLQTLETITKNCKLSDKELYRIICSSIYFSTTDEYTDGISYLVDLMSNVNEADGNENDNILSEACSLGLYKTSELLIDKNVELNGNVLDSAVGSRDISIVKLLIDNGIDVNAIVYYPEDAAEGFEEESSLSDAVFNGDYDIAKLLIENGAVIDKKSDKNMIEYVDGHISKRMEKLIKDNM